MTVDQYLDALLAALDCANDAELSRRLGVSHSRISGYRHGRVMPNVDMTRTIARMLDLPAATVAEDLRREKRAPK